MARIHPFQPYRYTPAAGEASDLVTQPYDKIPDELREQYLAASPNNFVRLIKGVAESGDDDSSNVYTRARAQLDQWIADHVLAQDPEPGFYPYFQTFTNPDTGERQTRKGFIGLLQVEDYDARVVHRHELTHRGPKVDRWKLADATQAYFGQLFFLYDDPQRSIDALLDEAAQGEPLMESEEEGVQHQVWRISDPAVVGRISELMADKKLLIADGHHRYETALAYSRENPEKAGAEKVMMTLVNMSSEGLLVLPTHRVLEGLEGFDSAAVLARAAKHFNVEKVASPEDLRRRMESAGKDNKTVGDGGGIGVVFGGDPAAYLFTAKAGALDELLAGLSDTEKKLAVVVLHRALIGSALGVSEEDVRELKGIRYVRGFENAVEEVRGGAGQVVFLLRPVAVHEVAEISFGGGVMPQKSTDFYPKLLSGFTTYRFG